MHKLITKFIFNFFCIVFFFNHDFPTGVWNIESIFQYLCGGWWISAKFYGIQMLLQIEISILVRSLLKTAHNCGFNGWQNNTDDKKIDISTNISYGRYVVLNTLKIVFSMPKVPYFLQNNLFPKVFKYVVFLYRENVVWWTDLISFVSKLQIGYKPVLKAVYFNCSWPDLNARASENGRFWLTLYLYT